MTASSTPTAPGAGTSTGTAFPWPLIIAGLSAMAAMYFHPGSELAPAHFQGLFVTAILLALSPVLPTRIPDTFFLRWSIRLAGYGAVLLILGWPDESTAQFYMKDTFMTRIGPLLAVELTLRAYLHIPPEKLVYRTGQALSVAAGIFICACATTDDRGAVFYLAPIFVLSVLQTTRAIAKLSTHSSGISHRPTHIIHRTLIIAVAFSLALPLILSIRTIDQKLTRWAVQVLQFDRKPRGDTEIGFSEQPQLQSIFNPKPSLERALVLHNTRGERHIRVTTFTHYNPRSHTWGPAARDRNTIPLEPIPPNAAHHPIRITALTDIGTSLPLPTGVSAIDTDTHPLARDNLGTFHLVDQKSDSVPITEWTATETSPDGPAPVTLLPPPTGNEGFLSLPDNFDPRIKDLARSIAGSGPPLDRLRRLEAYLRTYHKYSLRYDAPDDGDPLTDFILNQRAAHCQYFASALALMARVVDIPTRLVVGFYAYEPDGDNTLVRQRDAHAWIEAYVTLPTGAGSWQLADATPASGRPDELFEPPSKLRKFWESITDLPTTLREFIAGGALVKYILPLFAIGALVATIRAILRRRNVPKTETYLPEDPDLQKLVSRIERLLISRNLKPTPTQTWQDIFPQDLRPLLPHYNALRFGQQPSSLPELQSVLTQLEKHPPPPS